MNAGNVGNVNTNWAQPLSPVVVEPTPVPNGALHVEPAAALPSSKLLVLHVVNGEHFAGAERVQSHLGRCLPEYLVEADFVCVKPGKFADAICGQNDRWGRCYDAAMSGRFDLRAVWKIRKLVRRNGYDLLHAHTPRTAMIAALASKLAGVPWVYHVHSPANRDSDRAMSNRVNAIVESASLWNCSHLIAVSESLRLDCIRRGWSEDAVSVVHNGVPAICPDRISTPCVGGKWVLGMVALQRPRKGLEVLLESLSKLTPEHDVVLKVIGPFETSSYHQEIMQLVDQLELNDRVEWVGFTEDVPRELARLDALVLPSLFGEGLPMVVLEAMAAGLPVVATRVEGTPEAVTDGVEGLLAEPACAESLTDKIRQLITGEHDWQTMSYAARMRHDREFSDDAMARNTASVYQRVISDK